MSVIVWSRRTMEMPDVAARRYREMHQFTRHGVVHEASSSGQRLINRCRLEAVALKVPLESSLTAYIW
jgi:hypothetical protein